MILFYFNSLCCINYYAMNQLSWYILVTHLKTYNSILSGKKYQEWKAKIKRVEIVSFILLIIFFYFIYSNNSNIRYPNKGIQRYWTDITKYASLWNMIVLHYSNCRRNCYILATYKNNETEFEFSL